MSLGATHRCANSSQPHRLAILKDFCPWVPIRSSKKAACRHEESASRSSPTSPTIPWATWTFIRSPNPTASADGYDPKLAYNCDLRTVFLLSYRLLRGRLCYQIELTARFRVDRQTPKLQLSFLSVLSLPCGGMEGPQEVSWDFSDGSALDPAKFKRIPGTLVLL